MAVSFQEVGRTGAMYPLKYVADMFLDQTLTQLKSNMLTQRIWPYEVYPGYHIDNEYRRLHGGWYATGEGIQSFEGEVIEADENTGFVTMSFKFNDYLQYVDIGVGAGRKADDVERGKKVRYRNRYTQWVPRFGKTHRPAIMPELRHLATRLQDYTAAFYGNKFEYECYETFDGLTIYV